jgi:expansin (peptidoglycan-binding protein)
MRTLLWLSLLAALAILAAPATRPQAPAQPTGADYRFLTHLPITVRGAPLPAGLPPDLHAVHSGEGTYYDADGSGNCSFDPSPTDLLVAALNTPDYHGSLLCGATIEVTGPSGSVVVRVVDRCPECAAGDVDMSPQAFARIAQLAAGRVPITWRLLSPPIAGNIVYKFKEGSNQWWTAVQIRNHRNPIYGVEYRAADGTFQPMVRELYNYFIATSGLGTGPATLRVTDIYGNVITDSGIAWSEGAQVTGSAQFPAGP